MSRSYKKEPVVKDRGFQNNEYNKRHRRVTKNFVKKAGDIDNRFNDESIYYDDPDIDIKASDVIIPNTHEITNDYNVCDYRTRYTRSQLEEMKPGFKHKWLNK